MKENGYYKVSQEYIELIRRLGGIYKDNQERPVYCCIRDRVYPDIYWAIPTSDMNHRTKEVLDRIKKFCELPADDIRSNYYHIGKTNRDAIFRISNALPIIDKYIIGEYTSQGKHLIMRDKKQINEIQKKLSRILFDESRHPDKYEQHITTIKQHLIAELEEQRAVLDVAVARGECT